MKKIVIILLCLLFSHNNNFSGATRSITDRALTNFVIANKVIDTESKYKLLLEKLGEHESRGNSRIVNQQGCMGIYQFKESTLRFLGYEVSLQEFRTNPEHFPEWQQHEAALKFTKANKKLLQQIIDKYDGKVVNGIKITETGILAAAALAGHGGVKKYFRKGLNSQDCYGTSIEDMLVRFADV